MTTIRAVGRSALLLPAAGTGEALGLYRAVGAAIASGALADVVDVVPAARTVLVRCTTEAAAAAARPVLAALSPLPDGGMAAPEVVVPVRYDGADLADVAARSGLSVAEVVAAHTGADYRVAFLGFAPGFGYLDGLDPRLILPRLTTPRTRVPAGSVAIADRYAAVYPTSSPGGWHLLGHTEATLFDVHRDPPALLAPGTRVRFAAVAE